MSIQDLYREFGYFSLIFEKMTEWEWYTDIPCKTIMVHLILKCMKTDTQYRGETVNRGEYRTSLPRLARETGLTVKQVRTAIRKLESSKDVRKKAQKGAVGNTTISLCNFNKYQIEAAVKGQFKGSLGAVKGQTNNKETKETKKEKEKLKEKEIPSFNPMDARPGWATEELWVALVETRRKLKAGATELAYKKLVNKMQQAIHAGFTAEEIIGEICMRGWKGFDVAWMESKDMPKVKTVKDAQTLMNDQIARRLNEQAEHKTSGSSDSLLEY